MLQAAIDAQVPTFVAALDGRRDEEGRRLVVKNGSLPSRKILSCAGRITLQQGWARDNTPNPAERVTFSPKVLPAYRSINVPLVFFAFNVSRQRAGAQRLLRQADGRLLRGLSGDHTAHRGPDRTRGVRHPPAAESVEVYDTYPVEGAIVLAKFQALYALETEAATMSYDQRSKCAHAKRSPCGTRSARDSKLRRQGGAPQRQVRPGVGLPPQPLGDATSVPHVRPMPIDNNDVEQLMRQIALRRKMWLFVGSVAAGERIADFFTLLRGAQRPRRVGLPQGRIQQRADHDNLTGSKVSTMLR